MNLFVDFIITIFLYMALPVIAYYNENKGFSKKQLIQFVSLNSMIVYILLFIIFIIIGQEQVPNILPAFLYAGINYLLLKKHIKEEMISEKDKEENENLERFIELLEEENTKEK